MNRNSWCLDVLGIQGDTINYKTLKKPATNNSRKYLRFYT
jgi:hypothetical protein